MKSTIREIYSGERGNAETIKMSDKYLKIIDKIAEISDEFMQSLTEAQKKQFNEINWLTCGLEAENALSHYEEGFRIGLLLAFESVYK